MSGVNSGFTTIKYTTSSSENCVATKNNGVVTIKGDKNGVRQMKFDEFMPNFIKDQQKVALERTPDRDTVAFKGLNNGQSTYSDNQLENFEKSVNYKHPSLFSFSDKHHMTGAGFDVEYSDGFLGGRTVKGKIGGKDVELKVSSGFYLFKPKGSITGKIDGREVNIKYKDSKEGLKMEGIQPEDSDIGKHLALLSAGKINYDEAQAEMAMACQAGGMKI